MIRARLKRLKKQRYQELVAEKARNVIPPADKIIHEDEHSVTWQDEVPWTALFEGNPHTAKGDPVPLSSFKEMPMILTRFTKRK